MSQTNELEIMERIALDLERVEESLASSFNTGAEDFNALIRPLSAAGGKRLRAQLCLLIANAGTSIERQRIRRGEDTIHMHKGNKVAILSGDYLFAKAFKIVSEMTNMKYLQVFSHIITCLVEGEFMQMEDVYRIDQGIERYMTKTQKKTADFMEGCMELGGLLGDWQEDEIIELKKYGHALGMAFQITDDIMDYRETAETTGKPVGNDLREGLLTYPLLSIVNDGNKDKLLEDIKGLNNGGNEQDIIDYVIAQGGIDNTLAVADKYCKDALAALAAVRDFPGKEFLVMAVENLADRKV